MWKYTSCVFYLVFIAVFFNFYVKVHIVCFLSGIYCSFLCESTYCGFLIWYLFLFFLMFMWKYTSHCIVCFGLCRTINKSDLILYQLMLIFNFMWVHIVFFWSDIYCCCFFHFMWKYTLHCIVCFGLCRTINQLQMGDATIRPQGGLLDSRQINFDQFS